jgi:hypothetical protein
MEIDEAIMAFSQSEKIKAGLISISQAFEVLRGFAEGEKKGGEKIINVFLGMIEHEVKLARTVTRHKQWDDVELYIDKARVMVNSGVGHEATVHLSKALSNVTTIGQQSMTLLKERGLL